MLEINNRLENLILIQRMRNLNLKLEISKLKEQELILLNSIEKNSRIEESLLNSELSTSIAKFKGKKVVGRNIIDNSKWKDQAHTLRKSCALLKTKVIDEMSELQTKNINTHSKLKIGSNQEHIWNNEIKKQKSKYSMVKETLFIENLVELEILKYEKSKD